MGPYGLLFALYNNEEQFRTQAVISVTFSQSDSKSNANVYVIVGVLLGCSALCVSCCLVCIRFLCIRRKIRRQNARVHVYHNWNMSASAEQNKTLIECMKVQLDPKNPQECTICLEQMNDEATLMMLPCKHMFHTNCINAWFEKQNFCCVCKAPYDISRSIEVE